MLIAFFLISILCGAISIPSSLFAQESQNVGELNSLIEEKQSNEALLASNKSKNGNLNRMQYALLDHLEQKVFQSLRNSGWPFLQATVSRGNLKQNDKFKRSMQSTGKSWAFACGGNCLEPDRYVISEDELKDDVIMQFATNQDLARILLWTAKQLEALQNFNTSGDLKFYNNLSLSGRREGPLFVEEPRYVIVRREEQYPANMGLYRFSNDPFIPPRGRKHMPNLDELLRSHDLFVPNRGKKDNIKKKDKIKDIFKYEDLFYPNRGKKQMGTMIDSRPLSVKCMKLSSNCFTLFNDINNEGNGYSSDGGGNIDDVESFGGDGVGGGRIHDIIYKDTDDDKSQLGWNYDNDDNIDDDQNGLDIKLIPSQGIVKNKDRFVKYENHQQFGGSSFKSNTVGGNNDIGFDSTMQQRVRPLDSILSRLRQQPIRLNEQGGIDYNYYNV